jgi:hypothetical protein
MSVPHLLFAIVNLFNPVTPFAGLMGRVSLSDFLAVAAYVYAGSLKWEVMFLRDAMSGGDKHCDLADYIEKARTKRALSLSEVAAFWIAYLVWLAVWPAFTAFGFAMARQEDR